MCRIVIINILKIFAQEKILFNEIITVDHLITKAYLFVKNWRVLLDLYRLWNKVYLHQILFQISILNQLISYKNIILIMIKHIVFLKAINVGGHTVKMDRLKNLFEKMGFENVETFIASGNLVFDSKSKSINSIKKKIETELEKSLGYNVATFIRSAEELKKVIEYEPFKESELNNSSNTLYIGLLDSAPSKENQNKVFAMQDAANEFHFNNKELYWLCRKNFSDSGISGKVLEKAFGMETTIRNSTTIRKMVLKFCS